MDDAGLLASLRQQLDDLECEAEACRRRLLAEFHAHCRLFLRDVPPDTAWDVRRALAACAAHYPALRPEIDEADSPRPPPPPPADCPAFQPSGRPACSRDRDLELHGLFTPSYLPLLDTSSRAAEPGPAAVGRAGIDQTSRHQPQPSPHAASLHRLLPPLQPLSVLDLPADAVRSTVDDARSSVSSDKSDCKPPRSALRRSSSMSKAPQSPRRVRFEFMGAEVLPTTSPQPSDYVGRRASSPDHDHDHDHDPSAFASNLGGDTADDDRVPPRKVFSSDALRALSRIPREEGVAWTVVNADDDVALDRQDPPLTVVGPTPAETACSPKPSKTLTALTRDGGETAANEVDVDESSDDGFLPMAKARSSAKKLPQAAAATPQASVNPSQAGLSTPASQNNRPPSTSSAPEGRDGQVLGRKNTEADDDGGGDDDDDENERDNDDGVFYFETEGQLAPTRSRPCPRPASSDEDVSGQSRANDVDESNVPAVAESPDKQISAFATSPAIPIRHSWGSRLSTASSVKFRPGSLGSYKGQPVMMPIVRDPRILADATSDLRVDDKDDQIAMEEGSLPRFPSTLFSFKERFIMEEMTGRGKSIKDESAG